MQHRHHHPAADVDLTFTKAKPKFERRLGFSHFLDALTALAEKRCPAPDAATSLRQLIAHHLAPQFEMVQVACVSHRDEGRIVTDPSC